MFETLHCIPNCSRSIVSSSNYCNISQIQTKYTNSLVEATKEAVLLIWLVAVLTCSIPLFETSLGYLIYTYMYIYVYIHAYIQTYIHIYIYVYIYRWKEWLVASNDRMFLVRDACPYIETFDLSHFKIRKLLCGSLPGDNRSFVLPPLDLNKGILNVLW